MTHKPILTQADLARFTGTANWYATPSIVPFSTPTEFNTWPKSARRLIDTIALMQ